MAALGDLMEMEAIGSTKDVKVVVQAEFADEYMTIQDGSTLIYLPPQTFNLSTYETSRFKIVKDGNPYVIDSRQIVLGDKDMASSQTLANFIKWVKNNYPAEHYALVLWNHGSGWESVLQDQTANHYMNMQELKSALEAGGVHFDVIDFDACLMGMYEVAYIIKDYADYMVASEHTEPGYGDSYDLILAQLTSNPNIDSKNLAEVIVDSYFTFYQNWGAVSITKSALDLSQFNQFDSLVGQLADLLITDLTTERTEIEQARDGAQFYQVRSHKDFYDFLLGLELLCSNTAVIAKAQEVRNFITTSLVIKNVYLNGTRDNFDVSASKGIAVYIPKDVPEQGPESLTHYEQFAGASNPRWVDFIKALAPSAFQVVSGNFAFAVVWSNSNVDIDLYVEEPPNGEWASPWMGTISTNGYLSADSLASGEPFEFYYAKEYVYSGDYILFANLYDLAGNPPETAYFYLDTGNGWELCDYFTFDDSNPAPAQWWTDPPEVQNVANGIYSDWYIPLNCIITK